MLAAGAHDLCRGAVAQQQPDSVDDNGFARASFARQDVQAGRKVQFKFIDDRKIANV